jgi:hypothetical protein
MCFGRTFRMGCGLFSSSPERRSAAGTTGPRGYRSQAAARELRRGRLLSFGTALRSRLIGARVVVGGQSANIDDNRPSVARIALRWVHGSLERVARWTA